MDETPNSPIAEASRLIANGNPAEAVQLLLQALNGGADDWLAHDMLAECYLYLDDPERSEFHAAKAAELAEFTPELHCSRARHAKEEYSFGRAERECRSAIQLDAGHVEAWSLLAEVCVLRSRWAEALKAADKALQLKPGDIDALRWRAESLRMLGRNEAAQGTVEAALAERGDNPTAHLMAGDSALLRGHHIEALRHYQTALDLDPWLEAAQIGVCESLRSRNPLYRATVRIALAWARSGRRGAVLWLLLLGAVWSTFQFGEGLVGDAGFYLLLWGMGGTVLVSFTRTSLQDFWLQLRRDGRKALPKRFRLAANVVAPFMLLAFALSLGFVLDDSAFSLVYLVNGVLAAGMAIPIALAVKYPEDLRWMGYALTGLCWAAVLTCAAYGLFGTSFDTLRILLYVSGGAVILSVMFRADATRLRLRR